MDFHIVSFRVVENLSVIDDILKKRRDLRRLVRVERLDRRRSLIRAEVDRSLAENVLFSLDFCAELSRELLEVTSEPLVSRGFCARRSVQVVSEIFSLNLCH